MHFEFVDSFEIKASLIRPEGVGVYVEWERAAVLAKNVTKLLLALLEGGALLCLHTLSGGGVKDDLTESDALGSDLDELLVGDELDSLLKRKLYGGDEGKLLVCARRSDSGKMLLLAYVDLDIV